jgi:hypothetical protein
MPSLPTNLDPGVATSGAENMLHRALYEGLVNFKGSSTTEVEPVLAESFEPNADKSVWTFKLRRATDGNLCTPGVSVVRFCRRVISCKDLDVVSFGDAVLLTPYGDSPIIAGAYRRRKEKRFYVTRSPFSCAGRRDATDRRSRTTDGRHRRQ